MFLFSRIFSTFFYIGYSPLAPGTVGSLPPLILFYYNPKLCQIVPLTTLFFISIFFINVFLKEQAFKNRDPKEVVIDECIGQGLTCWIISFFYPLNLPILFGCFIIFRLFDILKPWPIHRIEKNLSKKTQTAALGIMFDDILAAFYGGGLLLLIIHLINK